MQAFTTDPELERALTDAGFAGRLDTGRGDVLGVFAQSGASKLAVFQVRRIARDVTVKTDGSATVNQRVDFTNAIPAEVSGDPDAYRGYLCPHLSAEGRLPHPGTSRGGSRRTEGWHGVGARGAHRSTKTTSAARSSGRGKTSHRASPARRKSDTSSRPGRSQTDGIAREAKLTYTFSANPQATTLPVRLDLAVAFPTVRPRQRPTGLSPGIPRGGRERWTEPGPAGERTLGVSHRPTMTVCAAGSCPIPDSPGRC